jgi:hypothetical protein
MTGRMQMQYAFCEPRDVEIDGAVIHSANGSSKMREILQEW